MKITFYLTKGERKQKEMFLGCLTSQQHASVSQERICSDKFTCCHSADQTLRVTQSQYTDTGPTSPSTDPIAPGAWQGSHLNHSRVATGGQFLSHWYDSTPKKSRRKRDSNPWSSALEADALATRPTRRSEREVEWPRVICYYRLQQLVLRQLQVEFRTK